jgi:sugar phosphate isomerase/epimerase
MLTSTVAALATGSLLADSNAKTRSADEPFGYCLNTSTIRAKGLNLADKIDIAARAGYQAIEPWLSEVDEFVASGGSITDLAKRIRLSGLTVESAIAFPEWIVDDDMRRRKGFDQAKRSFDIVRQLGGSRLAAPPAGATDRPNLDLHLAAERYRALIELGESFGVVPQVELWGFSKCLGKLGDVLYVAIESGHPKACVLLDVFHLYKGGSTVEGLRLVGGPALHVIHCNDYPAQPPRADVKDEHRIYPGDGIAPYRQLLRTLHGNGFRGYLSLELFNRGYWMQDPLTVARTGLEKMRSVVKQAFA